MPLALNNQPWAAQATLLAADTSKTIKAAPGVGNRLVVTRLYVKVITAGAQALSIEDTSATVTLMKISSTAAVGTQHQLILERGIELTVNEALLIKPAAAAPVAHVVAEGYITGAYGG